MTQLVDRDGPQTSSHSLDICSTIDHWQSSQKMSICQTKPPFSEMSGKFCQFAGQFVQRKINPENAQTLFLGDFVFNRWRLNIFPAYYPSNLQCLLNMKRPVFEQSRALLFLSGNFSFLFNKKFSDCRTAVQQHLRRFCKDCHWSRLLNTFVFTTQQEAFCISD